MLLCLGACFVKSKTSGSVHICYCQWTNGHDRIQEVVSIDTWVKCANNHDYPWSSWSEQTSSAMSLRGAMAGQYPQGKWNKSLGC